MKKRKSVEALGPSTLVTTPLQVFDLERLKTNKYLLTQALEALSYSNLDIWQASINSQDFFFSFSMFNSFIKFNKKLETCIAFLKKDDYIRDLHKYIAILKIVNKEAIRLTKELQYLYQLIINRNAAYLNKEDPFLSIGLQNIQKQFLGVEQALKGLESPKP